MPIALLKFPTDLLGDVFKLCDPFELYKLSKCSKRTQRSIMLGGRKNWKIRFNAGSSKKVYVNGLHYNYDKNEVVLYVDNLIYIFEKAAKPEDVFITEHVGRGRNHFQPEGYMSIQCPDIDLELFSNLLVTFGISIVDRLKIDFRSFESFSNIADILIGRNIEIKEFCVEEAETRKVIDAVNYMPLINQMNITQRFECQQRFLRRYNYQLDTFPNKIIINWSFWFNIDQLLNNRSARIKLWESKLSNQDINMFFEKWKKAGTFPNLRYLEIDSIKFDNKSPILEMIPPIEQKRPRIEIRDGRNVIEGITDAVQVTKDDGTVGYLRVELGTNPRLYFLVANPADTVRYRHGRSGMTW
ncbi:hypothetical protein B9Z55_003684 [Caenorhabditis nigoni]|uniref:F-box domain-containing protein n=1 Tax=Caenorhabditis nigoni TaxID=1611254 RepID=A0A2G5VRK9_9PELO|nr:hypothetical protein B9Z55_003684 [Caenorhabditis nigoni]